MRTEGRPAAEGVIPENTARASVGAPEKRPLIVDSSVAVKWYVPEPGSQEAVRLLEAGNDLRAPDLLVPELGNVLWKKVRRGELSAAGAGEIAQALANDCPVTLWPATLLIEGAVEIATRFDRTVYDSLYVAMAIATDATLVTADKRLANALEATSLPVRVRRLDKS